jgi:hypothetical protein
MARYSREAAEEILGISLDPTIKFVTLSLSNDGVSDEKEKESIDIRQAAENLELCIPILLQFQMWEEAAQAKFLMHYIHETWEWEQKLEARADFIQTESSALAERLHEIHGGKPHDSGG